VEGFRRRFVVPSRAELSVAGPVEPGDVIKTFETAFAAGPSPRSASASRSDDQRLPVLEPARGPAAWQVVPVERKDASQNDIHVVVAGDRSRPNDRGATSLLLYLLGETYYAGQLGRALVEPGLVYSVWTTLEEPPGLPGYLLVRTAASKENTLEVLRRIREVLEGAARGDFVAAELEEAKTYLRGKNARLQDGATSAAAVGLEDETRRPSAQEVTLEQLNDTARRLFARGAPLALVGGPGD
jgi:predicted Zn-dependent peptidase